MNTQDMYFLMQVGLAVTLFASMGLAFFLGMFYGRWLGGKG